MTPTTSTSLFNSAIAGAALSAAFELGLLEALDRSPELSLKEFCEARGLDHRALSSFCWALHTAEVVRWSPASDRVATGTGFADAYANKGYFMWLWRGYGHMLQHLAPLAQTRNRTGSFFQRDGAFIVEAGRDYAAFVDQTFRQVLESQPFRSAADLGCGSAERLIRLAKERQDFVGLGVEVNPQAAAFARTQVEKANVGGRVQVVHGDARDLAPGAALSEVEVVFSFFMGHDLWPKAAAVHALRRIREAFPRAERFLLCDTVRSELPPEAEPPIFTLGFELTHAVMGHYVPSLTEWAEVFEAAGWRCAAQHPIGIAHSVIFELRPSAKTAHA